MALRSTPKNSEPHAWNAEPEEVEEIRVPLNIGDAMVVRSPSAPARIASCKVIGAVHGRFILITEPAIKISDRVAAVLDETLLCSCLCDDYLYIFYSRYRNRLMEDIVAIEYPREVEIRRIREHTRVKVDIETRVTLGDGQSVAAKMTDISRGGCRLTFSQRVRATKGSSLGLTFELPNDVTVEKIEAVVAKIKQVERITETGLTFSGQHKEIVKVRDFCEFCRFV
ncbi:MAG: PilZ domain-containing protein [Syntrophobacteraceae bacterium]|nr:PilZ domain-containing protein [Syntrophobacteraceae bacterium]